jgi:hypothetical protein
LTLRRKRLKKYDKRGLREGCRPAEVVGIVEWKLRLEAQNRLSVGEILLDLAGFVAKTPEFLGFLGRLGSWFRFANGISHRIVVETVAAQSIERRAARQPKTKRRCQQGHPENRAFPAEFS